MVDFAGWEMPVRYSGVLAEHRAVRSTVGLFDVSHMGEIEVSGDGARDVCQRLTVNDVDRLEDGCAQYSMFCQPDGGVIDDVILYRMAEGRYLFCVNAANRATDFAWVSEHGAGAQQPTLSLERRDGVRDRVGGGGPGGRSARGEPGTGARGRATAGRAARTSLSGARDPAGGADTSAGVVRPRSGLPSGRGQRRSSSRAVSWACFPGGAPMIRSRIFPSRSIR